MSCCKSKSALPPKSKQVSNFILSVANAIAYVVKNGKISASQNEVAKRISVCNGCRHLAENRCSVCGCFVNMKVGMISEKCPLNKW